MPDCVSAQPVVLTQVPYAIPRTHVSTLWAQIVLEVLQQVIESFR
jgi:hypothetical protein